MKYLIVFLIILLQPNVIFGFTAYTFVKESDFETLATNALNNACSLTNPRKGNLEELIAIFKKAMQLLENKKRVLKISDIFNLK